MAMVKFTDLNEDELRKLEAAMQKDEFILSLNEAVNAAEVQKILADNDINFSAEEIEQIRVTLAKAMSSSGELSTDELDDVSGGVFTLVSIKWETKKGVQIQVNVPW